MAWCLQVTNHYLSQCWPKPMSPYGVTRLQWVFFLGFSDFFWPGLPFVNFDEFCLIPGQLEIMLCVKIIRSLSYNLRTRWFYEWKLWHDTLFKIHTWNSLTFPWHLPLFRISLTFFKIPWQFPDLEKIFFSLTFPWCVVALTLFPTENNEHYTWIRTHLQIYTHCIFCWWSPEKLKAHLAGNQTFTTGQPPYIWSHISN